MTPFSTFRIVGALALVVLIGFAVLYTVAPWAVHDQKSYALLCKNVQSAAVIVIGRVSDETLLGKASDAERRYANLYESTFTIERILHGDGAPTTVRIKTSDNHLFEHGPPSTRVSVGDKYFIVLEQKNGEWAVVNRRQVGSYGTISGLKGFTVDNLPEKLKYCDALNNWRDSGGPVPGL